MNRLVLTLPALALCLCVLAPAQADFSRQKRALDKAVSARDAGQVEKLLAQMRGLGSIEAFQHVLKVLTKRSGDLPRTRLELLKAGEDLHAARSAFSQERARLARNGAQSSRKLEQLQTAVQKATAHRTELTKRVKVVERIARAIRIGLGVLAAGLPDEDERNAARQIRSRLYGAKTPEARRELLGAAVWLDDPEIRTIIFRELERGDVPERVAVLVALAERGGQKAIEPALRVLDDEAWTVRAAAIDLLEKVGGKDAVRALIERLPAEEGRILSDVVQALKEITGQSFHDNEHLWREWLASNEGSIAAPKEFDVLPAPKPPVTTGGGRRGARGGQQDPARGGPGFYGISTDTKHPIYVLDFSGSMTAPLRRTPGQRPAAGPAGPIDLKGQRRVDGVARELLRSVRSLPRTGSFNVVIFGSEVGIWRKGMQPATQENKKALEEWILGHGPNGSTNLYGGVQRAFRSAGRGSFDKSYELAADTIFLLSDGAPTSGTLTDPADILREVRGMNELRRVQIHTVSMGMPSSFMRTLAEQNDGDHVVIN